MTSYHLIGCNWPVLDGLTFLGTGSAPLRTQVSAIAAVLGVTDTSTLFFFRCDEQDFSPMAHLDLDKSLDDQDVPPLGYIYVGVSGDESTTPKAQRCAQEAAQRAVPNTDKTHATEPTPLRPSQVSVPREHAMTAAVSHAAAAAAATAAAAAANATPSHDTPNSTSHPVKKLRFADEAVGGDDSPAEQLGGAGEAETNEANNIPSPTILGSSTAARSAMKNSASGMISSNVSDAARSPRVHVDPSPPVVIEANPQHFSLPSAVGADGDAAAGGAAEASHADDKSNGVANVLAFVGCDGLAPETVEAAHPLLLRLARALLQRKPGDVETWFVDFLCNDQLHSDTVTTNLVASPPSREQDGQPDTQEPTCPDAGGHNDAGSDAAPGAATTTSAATTTTATATTTTMSVTVASTSDGGAAGAVSGTPLRDAATPVNFAPVGDTVAERLTFGTSAGPGRAIVTRLAKLVLDVKPIDPEEFLWTRLTSRNFGEEAAMNTLLARTVDPETLMAAEDPTIAALLREIPVESPGFNVVANLLPGLFSRKPENPVNYMFDHLTGRARSSYAASMRSSAKLPPVGALGSSNPDASYVGSVESCTSRDEDLLDDEDGEEAASEAIDPTLFDGSRRGRTSSTVAHFLHALQRRNSVDKLRAMDGEPSGDGSPGSPSSLHVHPSDSVPLQSLNPRRVSIAPNDKRGSYSTIPTSANGGGTGVTRCGSGYSSNRPLRGGSGRVGQQEASQCSTPTTGRRGETEPYPLPDRHGSRVSTRSPTNDIGEGLSRPSSSPRRRGQRASPDMNTVQVAASVLSPSQVQEIVAEYAQHLAMLELRVQRAQMELASRRRSREYQERMNSLDLDRDGNANSAVAGSPGAASRTPSVKRAYTAEKETARYIESLQEQQTALMSLIDTISASANTAPCLRRTDGPGSVSGSSWRSQPQPQDDELGRRIEWLALEQQHMRSMVETLFVRNPSLGRPQ